MGKLNNYIYKNNDIQKLSEDITEAIQVGGSGTKRTLNYVKLSDDTLNISDALSISIASIGTEDITVNEVALSPGDPAINAADMINGLNTIQVVCATPDAIAFITYLTK